MLYPSHLEIIATTSYPGDGDIATTQRIDVRKGCGVLFALNGPAYIKWGDSTVNATLGTANEILVCENDAVYLPRPGNPSTSSMTGGLAVTHVAIIEAEDISGAVGSVTVLG